MTGNRLRIYPSPPVLEEQKKHPNTISKRVATIVDRYQGILDRQKPTISLPETELYIIAECLMDCSVDANQIDLLGRTVAEAGYAELGERLDSLSYIERVLIVEALPYDVGKLAYDN